MKLSNPIVGSLCLGVVACSTANEPAAEESHTAHEHDPLATCRELPAAAAAMWTVGMSSEPSGVSSDERIATAGASTWQVALDLLRVTHETPSIAVSPASMVLSLAMAERRQGGECAASIRDVLHFTEEGEATHQTLSAAMRTLRGRELPAEDDATPVRVLLQQSQWVLGESGGAAPDDFYGAAQHQVPGDHEAVREVINCVIEEQSQGLLPEFLPRGLPGSDTEALDMNVAFIQAPWDTALEDRGPLDFQSASGSVVTLPSIGHATLSARIHQKEDALAIEVRLRGGDLAAMFVVNQPGSPLSLRELTETLTAERFSSVRDDSEPMLVDFTMPSLELAADVKDYSGVDLLDFDCPLFTLGGAVHGAALQVDAKGIEAAAATVAEDWASNDGGEDEPELTVTLDRPFLVFVYDRPTGFVLVSARFGG